MDFFVLPVSVMGGLRVRSNGRKLTSTIYADFGKSTHDVLVEVTRGPVDYVYSAPTVGWNQARSDTHQTLPPLCAAQMWGKFPCTCLRSPRHGLHVKTILRPQ